MTSNRIWPGDAERGAPGAGDRARAARAPAKARPVGALKLPLPSDFARAESLDDGSLQIVDTLPLGPLGEFVAGLAGLVREGVIEAPASFAIAVRDGMTVRFERGGVRGDAAERMASAIQGIGESIREGRVDPQSFAMSLECGCGLRLSRADDAAGEVPRAAGAT